MSCEDIVGVVGDTLGVFTWAAAVADAARRLVRGGDGGAKVGGDDVAAIACQLAQQQLRAEAVATTIRVNTKSAEGAKAALLSYYSPEFRSAREYCWW